jgi:hypothetical protein
MRMSPNQGRHFVRLPRNVLGVSDLWTPDQPRTIQWLVFTGSSKRLEALNESSGVPGLEGPTRPGIPLG